LTATADVQAPAAADESGDIKSPHLHIFPRLPKGSNSPPQNLSQHAVDNSARCKAIFSSPQTPLL
jgi:hypothetical protein